MENLPKLKEMFLSYLEKQITLYKLIGSSEDESPMWFQFSRIEGIDNRNTMVFVNSQRPGMYFKIGCDFYISEWASRNSGIVYDYFKYIKYMHIKDNHPTIWSEQGSQNQMRVQNFIDTYADDVNHIKITENIPEIESKIVNNWLSKASNKECEPVNFLDKIKDRLSYSDYIVAFDIRWDIKRLEDDEFNLHETAKYCVGESADMFNQELNKLDFDFIFPYGEKYEDDLSFYGTVWLNNGSWITIYEDFYVNISGERIKYCSCDINRLPELPTRH